MPLFDGLMQEVANEARLGDSALGASAGGVAWQLGPLKKVLRVVEKLCLDPTQRDALNALDPMALDASGVLDTVRGMLTCNSMAHAHLALRCLMRRVGPTGSQRSRAKGVRSKNRFSFPSGGGWMDCLINVAVVLDDGRSFVCEVQIVHAQLLTVRAELGAHHGYNDYRAALELLEASHCLELGTGDVRAMKRFLVRVVFGALRDADDAPLVAATADDATLDRLAARQGWCLSTVGSGRPWPRLLDLDVDGHAVTAVTPGAHRPVLLETLQGLRGVKASGNGQAAVGVLQAAGGGLGLTLWSYLMSGHTSAVMSACVSPDGRHVVTASRDKTARVWLLSDGSLVRTLEGHTSAVTSACVSPDGRHVVTASDDSTARLWLLLE